MKKSFLFVVITAALINFNGMQGSDKANGRRVTFSDVNNSVPVSPIGYPLSLSPVVADNAHAYKKAEDKSFEKHLRDKQRAWKLFDKEILLELYKFTTLQEQNNERVRVVSQMAQEQMEVIKNLPDSTLRKQRKVERNKLAAIYWHMIPNHWFYSMDRGLAYTHFESVSMTTLENVVRVIKSQEQKIAQQKAMKR